jgi:hypothetical protein
VRIPARQIIELLIGAVQALAQHPDHLALDQVPECHCEHLTFGQVVGSFVGISAASWCSVVTIATGVTQTLVLTICYKAESKQTLTVTSSVR